VAAPRGHDEVAHTGEARERLRPGAGRVADPRHLGEAARHDGRLRVVPHAKTVDRARGEGDHVLGRGAKLDTDEVGVHVDAEAGRHHRALKADAELLVLAPDHGGRGKPLGDLLGVVRAREHRDGTVVDDERESPARRGIQALDEAEHRRLPAGKGGDDLAKRGTRDGDDDQLSCGERRVG
jgi:hypothetical protein